MPVKNPPIRERRLGFTLVELLMVVLVIGLLAALLLPVLAGARKQARLAGCTGHLRQLGMSYGLYAADYGGYPDPLRLVRSVGDRRLLYCPEDRNDESAASSYTFRAALPPDFRPYWERPEVDPATVLASCDHHLEETREQEGSTRRDGPARYPFKLILRAGGGVERVHLRRIREVLVPADRPEYVRVYPGEPWYDHAFAHAMR